SSQVQPRAITVDAVMALFLFARRASPWFESRDLAHGHDEHTKRTDEEPAPERGAAAGVEPLPGTSETLEAVCHSRAPAPRTGGRPHDLCAAAGGRASARAVRPPPTGAVRRVCPVSRRLCRTVVPRAPR